MTRCRFTLTVKYVDGTIDTNEYDYLHAVHDALTLVRIYNEYHHDVISAVIHDSRYGTDDVYEFEDMEG